MMTMRRALFGYLLAIFLSAYNMVDAFSQTSLLSPLSSQNGRCVELRQKQPFATTNRMHTHHTIRKKDTGMNVQAISSPSSGSGSDKKKKKKKKAVPVASPQKVHHAGRTATKKKQRPVFLTHERDFFRQEARLNSMDSYVLVSTLTSSMSFGCLVGFIPQADSAAAVIRFANANRRAMAITTYQGLCLAIQVVSGMSALCGLYATLIFSLTILYGRSALGAERDREYDKFLRRTVRARVRGSKCFSLSLALFALEAVLMLVERTFLCISTLPVALAAFVILFRLYKDYDLLTNARDQIFRD